MGGRGKRGKPTTNTRAGAGRGGPAPFNPAPTPVRVFCLSLSTMNENIFLCFAYRHNQHGEDQRQHLYVTFFSFFIYFFLIIDILNIGSIGLGCTSAGTSSSKLFINLFSRLFSLQFIYCF